MTFFSPDRANEQAIAQNNATERPQSLDQYANNGVPDRAPAQPYSQVADRLTNNPYPLIGKDGQQEQQAPVYHVNRFDAGGRPIGTTEYEYSPYQPNGAKLNGFVDRDAQGNITEFEVRKPSLFPDQKDVYMVFKATPDHPIDQQSMQHVFDLLRPDGTPQQRMANQQQLNTERPLSANLQHNIGNQVVALRIDPQTGQRYEIRDMRVDPNSGQTIAGGPNLMICWPAPDGSTFRYPVAKLPDREKADISNATWHGNLREPLYFLQQGQRPQPRRVQQPVPGQTATG